ncbi:MAG: Gfo/Idh/MocA family oxidoreductase [Pelolinea sp.]|nr:Gfo/Idh/MocA family oxidoreductase [Pelolinea sp.]
MKFLIAGLGSIGRRHLKNLLALNQKDIVLYRTHQSTLADDDLKEFPVESDIQKALAHKPDAVIISNPTALHMDVAIPAAEAGCALFIEKPLAYKLDDLQPLEKILKEKKNTVFSAFQFHFNPGLRKISQLLTENVFGKPLSFSCHWGEYLPDWHPWEDYRKSYAANKNLGGGVVLTLCHPFDYLRWLFGDVAGLFAVTGKASALEMDVEDFADAIINFRSGITGHLHLDYYRQPVRHDLEITCTEGVIYWDHASSDVQVQRQDKSKEEFPAPQGFERNQMFLDEIRHFIGLVEGKEQQVCDFQDGKKALELAWGVLHSGRYQQCIVFD